MNLKPYIQGVRKGREINLLEKEAIHDPFLADALEGYDKVKSSHEKQIKEIEEEIFQRTHPNKNKRRQWSIIGSLLGVVIIMAGFYFFPAKWKCSNELQEIQSEKAEIKTQIFEQPKDSAEKKEEAPLVAEPVTLKPARTVVVVTSDSTTNTNQSTQPQQVQKTNTSENVKNDPPIDMESVMKQLHEIKNTETKQNEEPNTSEDVNHTISKQENSSETTTSPTKQE
jgi:hypothetical protein